MGALLSSLFHPGLSSGGGASDSTRRVVLDALQKLSMREVDWAQLEAPLSTIPRVSRPRLQLVWVLLTGGLPVQNENILSITSPDGFNLLQHAIGLGCIELVRWILGRGCDVNRGVCSLPLHLAAQRGHEDIVDLLLKHGARVELETRMCYPGPHNPSCAMQSISMYLQVPDRSSDRIQSSEYFAIDADHAGILDLLMAQGEDNWLPWQQKRPLLHVACERGAWNCVRHLVSERADEINQCYDEFYPIHQAALQDIKFLELMIRCGADVTVRTATQQLTVMQAVLLLGKKSAEDTLNTLRLLLDQGCKEYINEPDSLQNTLLHALIIRYSLEESKAYGYDQDPPPWNKWDMLHLLRFLLQNGASQSINQPGNSALACVLRHVRDWEFRYELLDMLLQHGGNPNCVGRDGSVPLMVCLVPLINKDPLHCLSHTKKVFYLNSVRLLCRYGANPNCSSQSKLTPLLVLVFTASEYITLNREEEKTNAFAFIRQLLVILLQHGLDPNVRFSQRTQHILFALMDMVNNARLSADLDFVYDLTKTLLQFGANPNVSISTTEPMICHSQSSVFLKKSSHQVLYHYVQLISRKEELLLDPDAERHIFKLVWLYYYAMSHRELFTCLKLLSLSTTTRPLALADLLRSLFTQPRSLKQMARVAVCSALSYNLSSQLCKLPLPPPLRDYLLEWSP
ncbi:hypothetical protein LAZ67_23001003 [Cordylochernes scorpioides]|uniref:Alpha-latrotoxin n=1 Tax=Cordylochernes scorpioides TaxID=51811 RepID=A0ABY6LQI1_9ARAC|nr:hypothetical protein LAZ67_23001003 [Cordylochernes scorpioides]